MPASFAQDVSGYPLSVSGDQIVQNIIQVAQSDGVNPVSLDHDFYGISTEGRVFSMASFRVVENGPNSSTGSLELHVLNSEGVSVPVLTIGEDGATVTGSFNVQGESTSFETTSVVVEDKDMVLASGATSRDHLDGGGIILGTPESGTSTLLYDLDSNRWKSNIGIDVDTAASFSVGNNSSVLNAAGLTIGDVSLTAGSLQLSEDVVLANEGLQIGDVSVTPAGGFVMTGGSGEGNSVVIDGSGVKIGEDISLGVETGLSIGSDVLLDQKGLRLDDTEAALHLGETVLDAAGLTMGDVSLTAGSLQLSEDVVLANEGLQIGDVSITPAGGFVMAAASGESAGGNPVVIDRSGVKIGEDIGLGVETGLSIGSDVLLDQTGLRLKDTEAALYLGETGWKIAYDSSSNHLAFEYYDEDSGSYVTKAEIMS